MPNSKKKSKIQPRQIQQPTKSPNPPREDPKKIENVDKSPASSGSTDSPPMQRDLEGPPLEVATHIGGHAGGTTVEVPHDCVALVIPVRNDRMEDYIVSHVDIQRLTVEQRASLHSIAWALDSINARNLNGRRITRPAEAIKWLLEHAGQAAGSGDAWKKVHPNGQ